MISTTFDTFMIVSDMTASCERVERKSFEPYSTPEMQVAAGGFMSSAVSEEPRSHRGLLDAGLKLFLRHGLRKTSMEAIAAEAQVAKATAYARYPNKTAVFAAVVEDVLTRLVDDAMAAAAAEQGPAAAIERSMETKFGRLYDLVHTSEAGAELLAASNELTAEIVARAHARYVTHLAKLLVASGLPDRRVAPALAEVLDSAAEGVIARAPDRAEAERRIRLLVDRFVTR
ncbi:MAG: TetR/AcrR family transcriptional regulator [Myxococcaceae bacterium]|nr:TetR/AcrR family transcriptional regulator [Myxococcaceae bacterium]